LRIEELRDVAKGSAYQSIRLSVVRHFDMLRAGRIFDASGHRGRHGPGDRREHEAGRQVGPAAECWASSLSPAGRLCGCL
jgi:hypothetical protein